MKATLLRGAVAALALSFSAGAAAAADCAAPEGDRWDWDDAQVTALYECISGKMADQYASQGDEIGAAFRGWTVTSTRPAVAGPHGERFLQTFANDIAASEYTKFEEERGAMPVGSVLAKESFNIKKGNAVVGPLFIMTKVAAGEAPDAQDWVYSALFPSGKTMKVKQSFCAGCHMGFDYRDSMGYPLEEVRIGAGG